jgi:hypothetical protein
MQELSGKKNEKKLVLAFYILSPRILSKSFSAKRKKEKRNKNSPAETEPRTARYSSAGKG